MIEQKPLPELSLLKEYFEYDDGNLIWKRETGKQPKKGTLAGCPSPGGYQAVGFKGKVYRLHRIIYKLMTGDDPGTMGRTRGRICVFEGSASAAFLVRLLLSRLTRRGVLGG